MRIIRNNPALAAGIGLPLLVVLFFAVAATLPNYLVDPPKQDVLFVVERTYWDGRASNKEEFKIDVVEGRLKSYRRVSDGNGYKPEPRLFLYNSMNQSMREIAISPAVSPASSEWTEFTIPDVQALVLDPNTKSADGYMFETGMRDYYSSGVWPFYSGSNRRGPALSKEGRVVRLSMSGPISVYDGNLRFLGWVVSQ